MTLDENMNRFRLASRELFNHFFHVPAATGEASALPAGTSSACNDEAWDMKERFSDVEAVLFEKLVIEPAQLKQVEYGNLHPEIAFKLTASSVPSCLTETSARVIGISRLGRLPMRRVCFLLGSLILTCLAIATIDTFGCKWTTGLHARKQLVSTPLSKLSTCISSWRP
jgi:hypothetical protein